MMGETDIHHLLAAGQHLKTGRLGFHAGQTLQMSSRDCKFRGKSRLSINDEFTCLTMDVC
jgi:hypothetical protein